MAVLGGNLASVYNATLEPLQNLTLEPEWIPNSRKKISVSPEFSHNFLEAPLEHQKSRRKKKVLLAHGNAVDEDYIDPMWAAESAAFGEKTNPKDMKAEGQELFTLAGPPYFPSSGGIPLDNGGVTNLDNLAFRPDGGGSGGQNTHENKIVSEIELSSNNFGDKTTQRGKNSPVLKTSSRPRLRLRKKKKITTPKPASFSTTTTPTSAFGPAPWQTPAFQSTPIPTVSSDFGLPPWETPAYKTAPQKKAEVLGQDKVIKSVYFGEAVTPSPFQPSPLDHKVVGWSTKKPAGLTTPRPRVASKGIAGISQQHLATPSPKPFLPTRLTVTPKGFMKATTPTQLPATTLAITPNQVLPLHGPASSRRSTLFYPAQKKFRLQHGSQRVAPIKPSQLEMIKYAAGPGNSRAQFQRYNAIRRPPLRLQIPHYIYKKKLLLLKKLRQLQVERSAIEKEYKVYKDHQVTKASKFATERIYKGLVDQVTDMLGLTPNNKGQSSGYNQPSDDFGNVNMDHFHDYDSFDNFDNFGDFDASGGDTNNGGLFPDAINGLLAPVTNALGPSLEPLRGDQSLSRQDFFVELTTWFRRAIWFLLYTAAYTLSLPLLLIAGALSVAFELVLNANNSRSLYMEFMDDYMNRRRRQGKPLPNYNYDKYNWRYILGLAPDFLLDESSLDYEYDYVDTEASKSKVRLAATPSKHRPKSMKEKTD